MEPDYTTAFDALHTNNHIQKLKVLHAFAAPDIQHFMAVYIKFLELQYTLSSHMAYRTCGGSINALAEALCPFCSREEQRELRQLNQFMDSFETARAVFETMELMKDIFPAEASGEGDGAQENASSSFGDSSMMEQLLMGMLSDDQRDLFQSLMHQNKSSNREDL